MDPPASKYDCDTWLNSYSNLAAIEECQKEAKTPYCWPPNGTRICVPTYNITFYWPPKYYMENSFFDLSYRAKPNPYGGGSNRTHKNTGNATLGTLGIIEYIQAENIPGRDNENSLNMTIFEWQYQLDSIKEVRHQGPTLILVNTLRERPSASARIEPDGGLNFTPGVITGISLGAIIVAVLLFTCLFWCCYGCCGGWQKSEVKRVRRQQFLREQRAGVAENMVDAVPVSARAGASLLTIGSDEICPVEEQRVEQRRQEIARTETDEPPAYEALPPKYTP